MVHDIGRTKMTEIIFTDGSNAKSINPWNTEDRPEAWTWVSNAPQSELDAMYYRVAASFRAVNKRATGASNVPFALKKGDTIVDDSTSWKNVIKFMPKPKELIRRISMSQTFTNKAYLLRGKDVLSNTKNLNFLVPTTVLEITNPATGILDHFERRVNSGITKYAVNDPDLIKLWVLDHTTELLPSKNTAAQAMFNAVGGVYFQDLFIRNFFERGGVKQHVLAVKGAIWKDKQEDIERAWSRFLRGWSRFASKFLNAETMDVKPIGTGVDDLKNNDIYRQNIENIALAVGMPTSHLLSDWDSFATAEVDYMMWQRDDVFPHVESIADDLNIQVFQPLGYTFEFLTEQSDAETQDEVERAKAYEIYVGAGIKPSIAAQMVGIELPSGIEYAALDAMAEEKQKIEADKQQAQADAALAQQRQTDGKPFPPAKSLKANDTSAMIALRIPDPIRQLIKQTYDFVDQETLDNLHITLVYLGDNRTIDKLDVVRAVSDLGMFQAPIKGKLQGLARFRNGQDVDPLVMTFDSPQMPKLYEMVCNVLDNYHVPFHKDHGFIPHMTLAYIPSNAELPIDAIEPIEINFNEVYYVDGSVWYSIDLKGYDNKSAKPAGKWMPTLDEFKELDVWRQVAIRKQRKGEALDFEYQPHYGGLPEAITEQVKAALLICKSVEEVKAAFDVEVYESTTTPAPEYKSPDTLALMELAKALNGYAEAIKSAPIPAPASLMPNVNVTMPNITLTAQMPQQDQPSVIFSPVIQPSEVINQNNIQVEPTPVKIENNTTVQPAKVTVREAPDKKKDVKIKIERNNTTGAITGAKGEIE